LTHNARYDRAVQKEKKRKEKKRKRKKGRPSHTPTLLLTDENAH
jgi:hypothetical protein